LRLKDYDDGKLTHTTTGDMSKSTPFKIVLTENGKCLLCSQIDPDYFLIADDLCFFLEKGLPGSDGYWRLDIMYNKEIVSASKDIPVKSKSSDCVLV